MILVVAGLLSGCGKNTGEQVTVKRHSEESQESRTEEEGAVREENGKEAEMKMQSGSLRLLKSRNWKQGCQPSNMKGIMALTHS